MATDITPFTFPDTGQPVRTVMRDGEPWWLAADVAAVLGIGRTHDAVRGLDEDEKGTETIRTPGGQQPATVVNEPGLYSLILRSNKPQARAFKRWITHEVIPAIRRTGRYDTASAVLADPLAELERQTALTSRAIEIAKAERAGREIAEQQVRELEPAARAWGTLADATGDYSLRDAAHILNRDPAISTGQNRLMVTLRDLGMVDRRGIPYAKHNAHLVERATTYDHPHTGEPQLKTQVRITARGLRYLRDRLTDPVAPADDTRLFDTA